MRRLSIIDVVGGHQPIASEAGNVIAVCNVELYTLQSLRPQGHCFATGSGEVRALADAHTAGRADYMRSLWALITLHLHPWLEEAERRASLESAA